MSELKGTVVLDRVSQEALEKEVREKVIQDIKSDGFMHEDFKNALCSLDYDEYIALISYSITEVANNMLAKLNNPLHRDNIEEDKAVYQLLAIQSVLKI